jgi:iron-sulfur cluster repair protein YtfE (RIC family)
MDAVVLLKKDHRAVEDPFGQFERARSSDRKLRIVSEIRQELEVHTRIEEELFYPAYEEAARAEGQAMVAEAHEEHNVVKRLLEELESLTPDDEAFEAKVTVLQESIEHHVKEEETEMFPDARKRLKDDVETLGDRIMEMKDRLITTGAARSS